MQYTCGIFEEYHNNIMLLHLILFIGVALGTPYNIFPSKFFCLVSQFLLSYSYFCHIPACLPVFQKMESDIAQLHFFAYNSLILLLNLIKLVTAIFLSISYKPNDFQATTSFYVSHFHSGFYMPFWMELYLVNLSIPLHITLNLLISYSFI